MSSNWSVLFFAFILLFSVSTSHSSFADNLTPAKPKTLLWQILHGTSQENVICYNGLVLIKRIHPSYFAIGPPLASMKFATEVYKISVTCVKPETAQKLFDRNWGYYVASVSTKISMMVVRWNPNGYIQNQKFQTIDEHTIGKYPYLYDALKKADIQFENGEKPICGSVEEFWAIGGLVGTNQGPPCLYFQVPATMILDMLKDQNLKFTPVAGSMHETFINVESMKYRILISL